MIKIFTIVRLMLISTTLFLSHESTVVASDIEPSFASNDTLVYLHIPARSNNAIGGMEFVDQVAHLNIRDREKAIVNEILSGNVPSFSRKLRQIKISQKIGATSYELRFFAACDYMAIGSDQDYLYIPMTPSTAQYLADRMDCTLPTKKIVDIIYAEAEIKLHPQPIPPSNRMTTVPVFSDHTDSIKQQISQIGFDRSADSIIAGHKKDIIISNKIYSSDRNYDRVVIYGWHLSVNNPIQPVYNGHIAQYADYSHGVRLISNIAFINGDSIQVKDILQDATLFVLLSSEGIISKPYYPPSDIFTSMGNRSSSSCIDFQLYQNYPNPFSTLGESTLGGNPSTMINYQLAKVSTVDLSIFNLLGEKIVTLVSEKQSAGNYSVEWDALGFAGGVYIYKLQSGSFEQSRRMLLLR